MLFRSGKDKILQLYSVYNVTSYSSNGGFETSTGYKNFYFDLYDAETGKKINDKSIKIEDGGALKEMTETTFLTTGYNPDNKRTEIKIFDLEGKLKFDAEGLKKNNNGVLFDYSNTYIYRHDGKGYTLEGDDGRIYLLDDQSGKAEKIDEDKTMNM